jgi:predicted signal transduction protein with EAL and GGDEF domain
VLERIRERLASMHTGGHPAFTASFGLTDSTRAATLEQLLHLADTALYDAKENGRDRITISDATRDKTTAPAVLEDAAGDSAAPTGRRARLVPTLHDGADEEDLRPSGFEIR